MDIYMVIGLIAFFLFYGSYYAKMFMQKRQGIKTDLMGKGSKPKRTFIIEVILKIATFSMAAIQLVSILFENRFSMVIENDLVRYIGLTIALLGVVIFIIAFTTMGTSWRAGVGSEEKTDIINTGIYKYSRNPAFVGFDFIYIGIALGFSNIVNLVFTVFVVIMFHLQILEEEKYLPSVFGQDYLDYKKKTMRYIGVRSIK